jgi:hypothetical protein
VDLQLGRFGMDLGRRSREDGDAMSAAEKLLSEAKRIVSDAADARIEVG